MTTHTSTLLALLVLAAVFAWLSTRHAIKVAERSIDAALIRRALVRLEETTHP